MKVGETGKKFVNGYVQGVQRMGDAIKRANPFTVKSPVKPLESVTIMDELHSLHQKATAELKKYYFAVYEKKAKGVTLKFNLKRWEDWLKELGAQSGGIPMGREYKILQLGGLIPQPTGGWEIPTPTKEFMIEQLLHVLQGGPKFVICTEAPSSTFFDGVDVVYQRVGTSSVGVLSDVEFEIVPDSLFPSRVDGFGCVCFTLTVGPTSLKILNLHGDSSLSSDKAKNLKNVLDLCEFHKVDVVTGDMNITVSKTNPSTTLETVLSELGVNPSCMTLSTEVIEKKRIYGDILENNQLTKGGEKISEVDSMMILDINKYRHPESEPVPESPVLYGPLRAFTPYSETNSIIADHAVIPRSVKGILLVSVNTASVDDKDKGFLIKDEWADIDRPLFAKLVSQPYTRWWVPRCRQVLDKLTPEQKAHPEMQKVFAWMDKFMGSKSGGRPRPALRQGLRSSSRKSRSHKRPRSARGLRRLSRKTSVPETPPRASPRA